MTVATAEPLLSVQGLTKHFPIRHGLRPSWSGSSSRAR